jgi:hypothetical protein
MVTGGEKGVYINLLSALLEAEKKEVLVINRVVLHTQYQCDHSAIILRLEFIDFHDIHLASSQI